MMMLAFRERLRSTDIAVSLTIEDSGLGYGRRGLCRGCGGGLGSGHLGDVRGATSGDTTDCGLLLHHRLAD